MPTVGGTLLNGPPPGWQSPALRAEDEAIREGAGVSQVRLARALGVHRVTVARWESGDRTPRGTLRERYTALLDELRREVLNQ